MDQIFVTLIIYLIATFSVAWYFSRKESLGAYFLNKQKTGLWMMTFSIVATWIGAGATVAMVSETYNTGISYGIALPCALVFGAIFMGFLAKKIKNFGDESQAYTLVDFFEKRFDRKSSRLMLVLQLGVLTLWVATQAVAFASLASVLTDIDYNIVIFLTALITIAYTSIGGLKIDFITDFIQFWIILIVFIVMAFLGYGEVGGVAELFKNVPEGHLDPFAFGGVVVFIGIVFLSGLNVLGNSSKWQRIVSTESPETARKAFFMSIPIILGLSFIIVSFGLIASIVLGGTNPDFALFSLMEHLLPPALVGVGFAAILAVIMSSLDTLLIGGSTIIYREVFKRDAFENGEDVSRARMMTAIFGIIGFSLAFLIPKIVVLSIATMMLAVTIAIPVVFALLSKKLSANAAFYALLLSAIALAVSFPFLELKAFVPPVIISVLTLSFYDKVFQNKNKK